MRSSSGTKRSTASSSEDLPAALVDWISSASGRSSLREIAAQVPHQRVGALAHDARAAKVGGDPFDQVRARAAAPAPRARLALDLAQRRALAAVARR